MHRQIRHLDPEEHQETRELVKSAFNLAHSLGIKTLVVQADEIRDVRLVET
jgi:sugar phosphate isomerase/epimerase